jgi:hypothetical protein
MAPRQKALWRTYSRPGSTNVARCPCRAHVGGAPARIVKPWLAAGAVASGGKSRREPNGGAISRADAPFDADSSLPCFASGAFVSTMAFRGRAGSLLRLQHHGAAHRYGPHPHSHGVAPPPNQGCKGSGARAVALRRMLEAFQGDTLGRAFASWHSARCRLISRVCLRRFARR